MKINYASTHRWRKEVVDDPLALFGKSEQQKMKQTLKHITGSDVICHISVMDDAFLDWWYPLYESRISSKDNPKIIDIKKKLLDNLDKEKIYYTLTLTEGEDRLGGVIFSQKADTLFFAYRTLAYDWNRSQLRASPSLYIEYVLAKYAWEAGLKYISHGVDRNPYGLNSSIGLANFKLATGCRPQLSKSYEVFSIETEKLTKDILILALPDKLDEHADIKQAYLVADNAGMNKWQSVLKYPDHLLVETVERVD